MTKPMTKAALIAEIAERTGSEKKTAAEFLTALSGIISDQVLAGGAVTIPDIGKVSCRERAERTVRNPQTGEAIQKPADRVLKMTFVKAIKDQVSA